MKAKWPRYGAILKVKLASTPPTPQPWVPIQPPQIAFRDHYNFFFLSKYPRFIFYTMHFTIKQPFAQPKKISLEQPRARSVKGGKFKNSKICVNWLIRSDFHTVKKTLTFCGKSSQNETSDFNFNFLTKNYPIWRLVMHQKAPNNAGDEAAGEEERSQA